jgi:hypothetical protein
MNETTTRKALIERATAILGRPLWDGRVHGTRIRAVDNGAIDAVIQAAGEAGMHTDLAAWVPSGYLTIPEMVDAFLVRHCQAYGSEATGAVAFGWDTTDADAPVLRFVVENDAQASRP